MVEEGPRFGRDGDILWWIAQPAEPIQRASLALPVGDRRVVIEPVDCPGLDDQLAEAGGLDAVVVLMDRHTRDANTIADRHGVSVLVPPDADRITSKIGRPVDQLTGLPEGVELITVSSGRVQEEYALWWESDGTLVVPESLGTTAYFTTGGERVGIHPLARLRPPRRQLGGLESQRLFVGHGAPITDLKPGEIDESLANARRRLPRAWIAGIRAWLP